MRFIAKTLFGLEDVLAGELIDFGATDIEKVNRAVLFSGDLHLLYYVNYMSRTAISVLLQIAEFDISSADDLYRKSLGINWETYLDPEMTFVVVPVVNSGFFNHTGYAALKLKDSIADYFRNRTGKRPSVDTAEPDLIVNLHISNRRVTVSLDSSGDPLFKRGYRRISADAPLNEVLAAGMILLSGWKADSDFIDPMCGSGTIPVEAAMIASHLPAGISRSFFGFMKWKNYDKGLFEGIKTRCDKLIIKPDVRIFGYDISENSIKHAIVNSENASVESVITFGICDFKNLKPEGDTGTVVMNPPYGERLLQGETDNLYSMIGTILKHNFPGFTAWIISSNKESLKHLGLRPVKKYTLFNGALECTYLKYELYKGSRKGTGILRHPN